MSLNFHSDLLRNISLMLNADDYDNIIKVEDKQYFKEFLAHSNILFVRSPYFKNAFLAKNILKEDNIIIFIIP